MTIEHVDDLRGMLDTEVLAEMQRLHADLAQSQEREAGLLLLVAEFASQCDNADCALCSRVGEVQAARALGAAVAGMARLFEEILQRSAESPSGRENPERLRYLQETLDAYQQALAVPQLPGEGT